MSDSIFNSTHLSPDLDIFDTPSDGKYEWALHALDVLSSTRKFQDIVNRENVKNELYAAARNLIGQLVPLSCIAFVEVSETDMSFILADCSPKEKTDYIQGVINEKIDCGLFAWAIKQNRMVTSSCEGKDRALLLHVLVTSLGVKGMFIGVLENNIDNVRAVSLDTVSVVLQNLSSSLDTYFSKKLISNYNQQLEAQIRFRTRELEKAKKQAEAANVAKSEFLASMSHELNTPFNIIFGYVDLILEDLADVEESDARFALCEDIKKVGLASRNLHKMVGNIIYLAKLESGKVVAESEFCLLSEMLFRIGELHTDLIKKNNNALTLNIIPEDLNINVDITLLEKAIVHLFDNACKFTENGKVSINVVEGTVDANKAIFITVKDSGIGMKESDLKLLFLSFTQLDGGDQKRYEGLGLGLTITKRICRLIGASLKVESQLNEGSTFTIVLPINACLL